MSVLRVRGLWWRYEASERWVLRGVDLDVDRGELVGIVGPSGAGKTTLCLALVGVIPGLVRGVRKGSVEILGMRPGETPTSEIAKRVRMVFEDPEIQFIMLSVEDEIALSLEPLELDPDEMRRRIRWALKLVGLPEDFLRRSPLELSGGEKQRVAIAAAIAAMPEILILDEPTTDLDPRGKREVLEAISSLRREYDVTTILVEHQTDYLVKLADRVVALKDGIVVAEGDPYEILSDETILRDLGLRPPALPVIARRLLGDPRADPEPVIRALDARLDRERLQKIVKSSENPEGAPCGEGEALVRCEHVHYVYPDGTHAVRGVDLVLRAGELTALVGPNGGGKSTLARLIAGLLEPREGRVLIEGLDARRLDRRRLAKLVGYVFQNPDHQLFTQSVREEVAFGLRLQGLPPEEVERRVDEVLELLGLRHRAGEHPFFLSKGERRRLAIAAVLALDPRLLIVDEPTTGQDYAFSREIMSLLREQASAGRGVLVITHDMDLALEYADRMLVMVEGKIIADGDPAEILSDDEISRAAMLTKPGVLALAERVKGIRPRSLEAVLRAVSPGTRVEKSV